MVMVSNMLVIVRFILRLGFNNAQMISLEVKIKSSTECQDPWLLYKLMQYCV